MRASLVSNRRPTPALIVAIVALGFAASGGAQAAPNANRGEVTVVTLSGSASTTSPSAYSTGDIILLNGASTFTFTQAAGEAVELIASVDAGGDVTLCDVTTIVYGESGGAGLPLGARVDISSDKGERGEGSDVGGIAAPGADRTIVLKAIAWEGSSCDGGEGGDAGSDTWNIALRVSVVTLRN